MFGLTKKMPSTQTDAKNNSLNLSQQEDFTVEDIPIHTMQEDLEKLKNPNAQTELITPPAAVQKSDRASLSPKQKSSPFLSETDMTWNNRQLLEEKEIKKPETLGKSSLDDITLDKKNALPQTQKAKDNSPINTALNQKSAPTTTNNFSAKKLNLRLIFFYLISFLLLSAIAWVSYSYLKNKSELQQEPVSNIDPISKTVPTNTPIETDPVIKPTFSYSEINPNYLRLEDADSVQEKLKTTLSQTFQEGYKTPIEFILTDAQNKPISFKTFSSLSGLKLSATLLDLLEDNFSLFLYNNPTETKIGLSLGLKDNVGLEKALLQEERLLADGLSPLLFENVYDKTKPFEITDYAGAKIHYQNIISPDILSIDYAIHKNRLLFGTTRATMRAIIDRLNNTKEEVAPKIDPQLIPMPPIPEKAVTNPSD
jgi:hypothetical protein